MLIRSLSIAGLVALAGAPPASASAERSCETTLARAWQGELARHPIDPAEHVMVLSIDSRILASDAGTQAEYQRTVERMKRAFASFAENPTSGILTGCCAIPVWGAVTHDEFAHLRDTRFAALCEVARRAKSSAASVRADYRERYETGLAGDPYFFVRWSASTGY